MSAGTDGPTAYSGAIETPRPVALVVLPFMSEQQALDFANMVRGQHNEQSAIVTAGTAYEWRTADLLSDEGGQVLELTGGWDSYEDPARPGVLIIMRPTGEQH